MPPPRVLSVNELVQESAPARHFPCRRTSMPFVTSPNPSLSTRTHPLFQVEISGVLWDDSTLLDQSVCSAIWEEWQPKLPLGEDVHSSFLDMMDRHNLVQVGG